MGLLSVGLETSACRQTGRGAMGFFCVCSTANQAETWGLTYSILPFLPAGAMQGIAGHSRAGAEQGSWAGQGWAGQGQGQGHFCWVLTLPKVTHSFPVSADHTGAVCRRQIKEKDLSLKAGSIAQRVSAYRFCKKIPSLVPAPKSGSSHCL